ncbi:Cell shape-determining protein MreC [Thalassoglobus neptunius]|uniref:Cell shape-determining protein MreC n=1 Tax=Thalassoglobus neptunius TaxID=1938619 RepID=A0A5C5X1A8_9PLAN|nr:rod shape-determining protein MreC [Thalassoglobus neptunius]TWT56658.1 Cell shape-determining protein MreC [Thalassoglobus neptunius]
MPASWRHPIFCFVGWVVFALLLHVGPTHWKGQLRTFLGDAAGLTLQGIQKAESSVSSLFQASHSPIEEHQQDKAAAERFKAERRDLQTQIAQLQRENERLRQVPEVTPPSPTSSLLKTRAIDANVLGVTGEESSMTVSLLVSAGSRHGISSEELVLEQPGLLIDQGENADIRLDRLVTTGRALLGRTHQVGRWTTVVQPIFDPQFRMAVRLVRESELGLVVGSSGILEGTGEDCRILEVKGTEPVAVGDLVYTDLAASLSSLPIYCGRVTEATILPQETHWTIRVAPVWAAGSIPKKVSILQTELKPDRGKDDPSEPESL